MKQPTLLDSKDGAELLMKFARESGAVISEWHERLAIKWGVSTQGVTVSRPLRTKS